MINLNSTCLLLRLLSLVAVGALAVSCASKGAPSIGPDSLLSVRVVQDPSLNGVYRVTERGALDLRYLGPIPVATKPPQEIEGAVREILGLRQIPDADVRVTRTNAVPVSPFAEQIRKEREGQQQPGHVR